MSKSIELRFSFFAFTELIVDQSLQVPKKVLSSFEAFLNPKTGDLENSLSFNLANSRFFSLDSEISSKSKKKEIIDQVLRFNLNELRDARLAPIVDFKGRRSAPGSSDGLSDADAAFDADSE